MANSIEHEKRKREILKKALSVFIREGYANTTFQKISEHCNITRTILYVYFKNKNEIFTFSIKLFIDSLEQELKKISSQTRLNQEQKLLAVARSIMQGCYQHSDLIMVILAYLQNAKNDGEDIDEPIRRRTIRVRHFISGIVIEGINKREFAKVPVKPIVDLFYMLFEVSIFHAGVLRRQKTRELLGTLKFFIEYIRIKK